MNEKQDIKPLFFSLASPDETVVDHLIIEGDNYNRTSGANLIGADDDVGAILGFLREFQDSKSTLLVYAKELERLFLWSTYTQKLNISSLKRDDLLAYQAFLKKPTPKKIWCGTKAPRLKKDGVLNTEWRVFYSPLSDITLSKISAVLETFFNYLVQGKYLLGNPMAMDRRRKKSKKNTAKIIDRYLELDEIHAVLKALSDCPIESEKDEFRIVRARYIILLLFYTGLRIAEAGKHTMGDFLLRDEEWFLRVMGKGKKLREIPIPDELMDAMEYYRKAVGLTSPTPTFREKTPLIPMKNLTQAITTRRIDQILKWAFGLGAQTFERDAPHKASKLQAASAHWLRHSYVTYLLNSGASLKVAQENAGHSNIATTMHYRHVNQTDRHKQTRALSLKEDL